MKRLLTLLFFALFALTTQAQTVPNLPPGSVPFGTGLFRAPDDDIWGGSKFDGYVNLGNWQRVADSLGVKINWSDTTIIASKEWVEGKLNSLPPSGVLSVTGDGVDNTDPANPVLSYPDPSDIGALAPGDDISELTNDAGYLNSETDPIYSGDPASSITQNDIDAWNDKQDAITGAATTVVSSNLTPSRALISNGSGKIAVSPVSAAELAFLDGVTSNVQDQLDDKIPLAQKGASNGVAPIGNDGKIPGEYLPSSGSYKGTWDASTNTPTIADGVGTNGDRYRVAVGGTVDLGSGPITFVAGDDVIYNGTVWQRSPSGVTVTSVAGKTGDVVLDKNDVGLGNVDNTSDMDKPISTAVQNALDLKLDASEISNYYTKTQMQTSGQAQLHWDNITNVPGGLGAQTLSLGSLSGEISISGGNSVRLSSLFRGDSFSGDISELSGGAGFYTLHVTSGATGFPSGQGSAVYFSRGTFPGTSGSFMLFAPTGNTNKMYYTTGSSDQTWLPFQTFASEGWVSNNYYTKTNLQTSGQAQVHWGNITNVPSGLGVQTLSLGSSAGRLSISGGNSVDLASVATSDYSGAFEDFTPDIGLWPYRAAGGSTGYPGTSGGGIRFNRNATNNSGSFDIFKAQGTSPKLYYTVGLNGPWAQYTFASEEWTLSQPFGAITQTDIDKWNSAFTPEDIGFGLHTDANGKLAWGTSIGGGTIGFKTDSLLFFANQAQTTGVLIGNGMTVAIEGEQTFVVSGTTVSTNPSDVFRAVAGDNTGEQVASISAGRLTDPDRAIVQAHTLEGEGAFVNMSAFSGPNIDFPVKSVTMSAGNASISVTNRLSPEGKSGFVYNGNTGNSKGIMEMSNLTDGNLLIDTAPGAGIILRSPNDTKYLLTVDDAGNLTTTLVP